MKSLIKKSLIAIICLTIALPWSMIAWAAPITLKKEQELGKRFHLKIAEANVLMDDPIANKYYRNITSRIMKGAGLRPDQYNFYIINSDGINAFAVPGGYIYMYTGTIMNLENEGQLASILGHEVAHITSRHYARRVEAASGMSMASLVGLLVGVALASQGGSAAAWGQAAMVGSAGATIQSMLANSREDEAEADGKGRQYLTKAGYNARDMYGAFRIMASKTYQVSPKSAPTYMTTHPALTSRLATTFKDYENSQASPPDLKYQAFRDRVLALSGEERRVQAVMSNRLNSNKNDHSALHALGLLAARQQQLAQADKLMNQALALEPGNREYLADLGDVALRRRQPAEAKKYYEKAGQDNRQAILGLARANELLGEKSRAGTLYDRAVNMDSSPYPEALELAGRFFGQIGQEGKGHYYLARYFASKGKMKDAIFHYKETAKRPDAGQYKAIANREIDILTEIEKDDKK